MIRAFITLLCLSVSGLAQSSLLDPAMIESTSPFRRGLVGYWRLEEAAGIRYDRSSSGNHLSSSNSVTQQIGKVAYCAGFASASNQALVGSTNNYATDSLTVSAWVNLTSKVNGGIVSKWDANSLRSFYLLYGQSPDRFVFDTSSSGTTAEGAVNANAFGSPSLSTWYHVVGVYNAENHTQQIYVNANSGDSASAANPRILTSASFAIGCALNAGAIIQPINGLVDEVGLWNRVLTTNEIAKLYNAGRGVTFPRFSSYTRTLDPIHIPLDSYGAPYQFLMPIPFDETAQYPTILYHHGNGGSRTDTISNPIITNFVYQMRTNGFIVASNDTTPGDWGNQAALDSYQNQISLILSNSTSNQQIVLWGYSMGGLASLLNSNFTTNIVGWFGTYPVCNLFALYSDGVHGGDIKAAYGIAPDGSDYATKTSGHDPMLLNASHYDGLRMRFYASYGDTVVSRVENSDALSSLVAGHATENTVVTATGNHGDPSHFQWSDLQAFLSRCTGL